MREGNIAVLITSIAGIHPDEIGGGGMFIGFPLIVVINTISVGMGKIYSGIFS